jgi:hypothetical protein
MGGALMPHAYPWARDWGLRPEVIASCRQCKNLVLVSPRGRLVNPYSSDRERVRAMVGADAWQGFELPGGSTHSCGRSVRSEPERLPLFDAMEG